jgi:hypothetical protein
MPPASIPKIFVAGGVVGGIYYFMMRQHWFPDPRKTSAVQNIENRHTAGGAAPNHTPATNTKRGTSVL